jgi:diguanylate cyclase (GGDEF)-like protein/PAS domain S-box-containing protein
MAIYGLAMSALTALFYAVPAWQNWTWTALGLTSVGAVLVGTVVHRPRRGGLWLLVAAALLTFIGGDTVYNLVVEATGVPDPFPSVADAFYLAMYPLLAAALLGFIKLRGGGRDRGRLLDALTLTVGLTLLSWIFLMVPYLRDPELSILEKAVSLGYPLGDVLILAAVARLLTSAGRSPAVILLGIGTLGTLVADVLYGLIQLNGAWRTGGPVDLGWAVSYAAWGAAALHPSMVRLTEPAPRIPVQVPATRTLVLLGLTTLIAPMALLIEASNGEIHDAPIIAAMSGLTFLMVLLRLSTVVATYRQALSREYGLREASATLVAAADIDEATAALRTAVSRLLPPGTAHHVVVALGAGAHPWADRERVAGAEPGDGHLVRTADAGAPDGALDGFEAALIYPLTVDQAAAASPFSGAFVVAAREADLLGVQATLEVLVTQAALALARIALAEEVNRRNSEAYFRTLVLNASEVILIIDAEDEVRYASPSATAVFGTDALVGISVYDLVLADERPNLRETVAEIRHGNPRDDRSNWRIQHIDGTSIQTEIAFRDLRDDPTVDGLVLTVRDVTERRQLERDLTHQAFHDSLTGLANRVLFQDRVQHSLARADRHGGLVGVLIIDLDDFKIINETMGHHIGDELLVAVAGRLQGVLRAADTAARLGGDEFAALIEDATHSSEIDEVAQRIVAALAKPFGLGHETVSSAASVGVATTTEASTAEELLRQADMALYVAKGAGKNQSRRYQATLHTALVERLELRTALDHAVSEGAFALHYQPIVALATGDLVGFEALVRWPHPTRGLVPPGEFIEVAEECGLIVPIGAWVLDHALETTASWLAATPPGRLQYVSVNVSARQFRSPRFAAMVGEALERFGVPRSALMLEITESLLLRDDEQVWADLTALRDSGVRIAIDDFGTGYSSLSYLRKFPIDVLKIDKSFIDDLVSSEQQRAVVDAIVRLAQTLNLTVVAEGIEEPAQRDLLAEMGCPLGQGYLFSRPVPTINATAWLQREAATLTQPVG